MLPAVRDAERTGCLLARPAVESKHGGYMFCFCLFTGTYYPRESFREGLWNHRRTFVCPDVCLFVTTITK